MVTRAFCEPNVLAIIIDTSLKMPRRLLRGHGDQNVVPILMRVGDELADLHLERMIGTLDNSLVFGGIITSASLLGVHLGFSSAFVTPTQFITGPCTQFITGPCTLVGLLELLTSVLDFFLNG